jgi:hypothetical protein
MAENSNVKETAMNIVESGAVVILGGGAFVVVVKVLEALISLI